MGNRTKVYFSSLGALTSPQNGARRFGGGKGAPAFWIKARNSGWGDLPQAVVGQERFPVGRREVAHSDQRFKLCALS